MKEKYAIPYTIDASFLNARAKLKDDKTGVGFDKKWSVRSILTFIGATVAYGWLVFKSGASKILALQWFNSRLDPLYHRLYWVNVFWIKRNINPSAIRI